MIASLVKTNKNIHVATELVVVFGKGSPHWGAGRRDCGEGEMVAALEVMERHT